MYDAVRLPIRLAESCNPARPGDGGADVAAPPAQPGAPRRALDGAPLSSDEHPAALAGAAAAAQAAGDHRAAGNLLDRAAKLDAGHPSYYGSAWVDLTRAMLVDRLAGPLLDRRLASRSAKADHRRGEDEGPRRAPAAAAEACRSDDEEWKAPAIAMRGSTGVSRARRRRRAPPRPRQARAGGATGRNPAARAWRRASPGRAARRGGAGRGRGGAARPRAPRSTPRRAAWRRRPRPIPG